MHVSCHVSCHVSGLSCRSAFVHSINSLILSGFPIDFIRLTEANLVPRAILKIQKPLFFLPLTAKRCAGVKVELKPRYLLFCGFMFLCVQLSKNITKWFLFIIIHNFSIHFAITCFIRTSWKRKQTMEQQPHRICEWTKSKSKQSHVTFTLTTLSTVRFSPQTMQQYY